MKVCSDIGLLKFYLTGQILAVSSNPLLASTILIVSTSLHSFLNRNEMFFSGTP